MKKELGIKEFELLELSICNRHFRVGNPTAMAPENVRYTLDLPGHVRHLKITEATNDHQFSSQLLTLNCTQSNFYQILSLSNTAIEAMV